jgi:hypothetical protein
MAMALPFLATNTTKRYTKCAKARELQSTAEIPAADIAEATNISMRHTKELGVDCFLHGTYAKENLPSIAAMNIQMMLS